MEVLVPHEKIVNLLLKQKEPISEKKIALITGVRLSSISTVLKEYKKNGYLITNGEYVSLTPKARYVRIVPTKFTLEEITKKVVDQLKSASTPQIDSSIPRISARRRAKKKVNAIRASGLSRLLTKADTAKGIADSAKGILSLRFKK